MWRYKSVDTTEEALYIVPFVFDSRSCATEGIAKCLKNIDANASILDCLDLISQKLLLLICSTDDIVFLLSMPSF
jgi:hypothetical protein